MKTFLISNKATTCGEFGRVNWKTNIEQLKVGICIHGMSWDEVLRVLCQKPIL